MVTQSLTLLELGVGAIKPILWLVHSHRKLHHLTRASRTVLPRRIGIGFRFNLDVVLWDGLNGIVLHQVVFFRYIHRLVVNHSHLLFGLWLAQLQLLSPTRLYLDERFIFGRLNVRVVRYWSVDMARALVILHVQILPFGTVRSTSLFGPFLLLLNQTDLTTLNLRRNIARDLLLNLFLSLWVFHVATT